MRQSSCIEQLTLEQKFAKVLVNLRSLRPFYSAIYEVMEKIPSKVIPTCGVTSNKMYYNEEFLDKVRYSEMVFIILHEIAHMALEHPVRRENRNPDIYNIACDLYVNAVLAEEFKLFPGQTVQVNDISITMPMDCVFCSTLDTDKEYVENIYETLIGQAKENGFFDKQSNTNRNPMAMPSSGGDTGENDPNNGENSHNPMESGRGYYFEYSGTKKNQGYGRDTKYDTFRSYIHPNKCSDILIDGDDPEMSKQKADKLISDAMVRVEMSSSGIGNESCKLLVMVKNILKSELDWRKLLRKYLIAAVATDSSFSRPDKRMYYQKSIYPGQVCEESNMLSGVKVCIDTSGSISDTDLQYFFGQVHDLVSKYRIKAELIFWDAEVASVGEFETYKKFTRVDVLGRGGTDPACVFNYFDSKKCKVKPIVTLMLTDGWFDTTGINSKQRKKYKDTIWIMTRDYNKEFVPPFGKLALAKFKPPENG